MAREPAGKGAIGKRALLWVQGDKGGQVLGTDTRNYSTPVGSLNDAG